jgi:hypothetical protein
MSKSKWGMSFAKQNKKTQFQLLIQVLSSWQTMLIKVAPLLYPSENIAVCEKISIIYRTCM